MQNRGGSGKAAALGAVGCLGMFLVGGVCVAATGGTVYADAGGLVLLLVIGAVLGLIVFAIYSKGQRDVTNDVTRRSYGPPPAKSVDELIQDAKRAYDEGTIDKTEYDRRVRRAWGHRD